MKQQPLSYNVKNKEEFSQSDLDSALKKSVDFTTSEKKIKEITDGLFSGINIVGKGIEDAFKTLGTEVVKIANVVGTEVVKGANIVGDGLVKGYNVVVDTGKEVIDSKIPGKKPCPSGLDDDGTSCSLNSKTKPLKGYVPHVKCEGGQQQGLGNASWCDNGPKWDFWNLRTWDSIKSCDEGDEIIDGLCQQKCQTGRAASAARAATKVCTGSGWFKVCYNFPAAPAQDKVYGYHSAGCCLCEPDEGIGIKVTAFERYQCPPPGAPEYTRLKDALCYKPK
jgi:hypothetical protein